MKALISLWVWVATAVLTITLYFVVFFVVIISWPFDKSRKLAHAQCFWWSNCILRMNPFWKLEVNGLENIDHKKTYVIISNHQSMADIVVLYKIHTQFKWVSKESLFRVPFIGWCLSLTKHIKLARGEFSSIKKIYREAAEWLRKDMSVLFFPEGTRSETDEMNVFQNGAFKLAIKEKKPILPICLKGTRETIPKGSWVFRATVKASLTVLPAIETSQLSPGDFVLLRDEVFAKINSA
ncbi:MAG: lysophospholipid acyltransferase family protein [Candidatus Omnitrophica bacterium]|nr:lysophospholipid acyltransferase family protein [Candidatus Omnitrophota bacterium]